MDQLLTIDQAADLVQVHPRTIRRAIDSDWLRAHQVGGEVRGWRIKEEDLEEWVESRANRPRRLTAPPSASPMVAATGRGRRGRRQVGHLSVADPDSQKAGA